MRRPVWPSRKPAFSRWATCRTATSNSIFLPASNRAALAAAVASLTEPRTTMGGVISSRPSDPTVVRGRSSSAPAVSQWLRLRRWSQPTATPCPPRSTTWPLDRRQRIRRGIRRRHRHDHRAEPDRRAGRRDRGLVLSPRIWISPASSTARKTSSLSIAPKTILVPAGITGRGWLGVVAAEVVARRGGLDSRWTSGIRNG